MSEDFACRGSLCRVQAEERGEQGSPGGSQKGNLGSKDVASILKGARETERAGIGEAFEAGPGGFGGNTTEFEDLEKESADGVKILEDAHLRKLIYLGLPLQQRIFC